MPHQSGWPSERAVAGPNCRPALLVKRWRGLAEKPNVRLQRSENADSGSIRHHITSNSRTFEVTRPNQSAVFSRQLGQRRINDSS